MKQNLDRFLFKAVFEGKVYEVFSFCDTFVKITRINGDFEKVLRNDCILLQSTGLRDKHEKLCYEGDIVEYLDYNTRDKIKVQKIVTFYCDPDSSGSLIITPFNDPCLGTYLQDGRTNITCHNTPSVVMEIIGNIYENETLLEKQ